MTASQILELPGRDALDELDVMRNLEHLVAVDRLKAVARFLAEHGTSSVDPGPEGLPGRQRSVRLGGEGTPKVAEFAPALAAGRLELSAWASARLCADVLDLVHRLPRLWASVGDYVAKASLARTVAAKTRHLSPAQAAVVDERVTESADGRLGYGRFLTLLEGVVTDVDAEAVAAREAAAAREQFAKPTQSTEAGMRGFYVRAPFPVIARLDATVAHLADAIEALGQGGTLDERRVLAVLVLANPAQACRLLAAYRQANAAGSDVGVVSTSSLAGARSGSTTPDGAGSEVVEPDASSASRGDALSSDEGARRRDVETTPHPTAGPGNAPEGFVLDLAALLPRVVLYVHLSEAAVGGRAGVARFEDLGHGSQPVTAEWVRRWLGPRAVFTIKPVFVPEAQIPVDAYEVPARHREAVHLMSPGDVFPWAANTSRRKQVDHTDPYDTDGPPGQSRIGNYGPMTTLHHRIKTHGDWQCQQPYPGIYLWRDPTGATYLVDHTGTRRLHPAA